MELQQLRYFTAIADEGTISAAARKLHMTQPPLSQQLKLLEEEFGTPLFVRSTRQMILTDAGRHLYKRAKDILGLVHMTDQEMENHREGKNGILRIGVISSAGDILLNQYICPFTRQYPDITYEITEGNSYELLDLLKANRIDLAVIRTPFESDSTLKVRNLREETLVAAGKPSFFNHVHNFNKHNFDNMHSFDSLAAADSAKIEDSAFILLKELMSMRLIIYRRWQKILEGYAENHNEKPDYLCVNDDARTTVAWADAGLGVAIVPESAKEMFRSQDMIFRTIINPTIPSNICAVTLKNGYMSTAMRLFSAYLQSDFSTN